MKDKIISLLFCLIIVGGGIAMLAVPDKTYSDTEKRTLASAPTLSIDLIKSGELSERTESYLSDQFPLRDSFVALKTLCELAVGKREIGSVVVADDGYLIDRFGGVTYNKAQYAKNLSAIGSFIEKVSADGVSVHVMPVPTASEILSDKLPALYPALSQTKLIEQAKNAGLPIIDTTDVLMSHNDEYIYYKTDHHYTSLGAYYCYTAFAEAVGREATPLTDYTTEVLTDSFRGTSYNATNMPFTANDTITAYKLTDCHRVVYNGITEANSIYERSYLNGSDKYGVFLNSNQVTTVIYGDGDGKLLIIKDSYANAFAQFVVDEYAETHLIDLRFYSRAVSDYIKENGITDVLILYNLPNLTAEMTVTRLR